MSGTIWALVPPIVAIALALWTKEVYLSLLIGILSGALLFTKFHILTAVETVVSVMNWKIGDNVNILLFLVFLGILVALITKSGASRSYGEWASRRITTKKGALFSTMFLGILIFVDDYFNCLTVGTVMRPVTDKHKISRAKLAYIIDATAAPVCIIAPISSWAAAVGSSLPEDCGIDGFSLFLRTIPFNLYALLTLLFMVVLTATNTDFGAMAKYNAAIRNGKEEQITQYYPEYKEQFNDLHSRIDSLYNKFKCAAIEVVDYSKEHDRKQVAELIKNEYPDISGLLFKFLDMDIYKSFLDTQWQKLTNNKKLSLLGLKEEKDADLFKEE